MARSHFRALALFALSFSLSSALGMFASTGFASAQAPAVVSRLTRFGRMDRRTAQATARAVHEQLVANGRQGPSGYDPLRQILGGVLFGGPGQTRAEYDQRLHQVVERLSRGLTEETLEAYFRSGDGVGARCARLFSIPMPQCDALVAAADQQEGDLPYIPPDDGEALREELVHAGIEASLARTAERGLTATFLSVPASADDSPRGRRLARLMRECPGGLGDEESQIRAWHMGATSGMVRCVIHAVGREGQAAVGSLRETFGLGAAAVPMLRWAHDQAQPSATPPAPRPPTRDQLMAQATAHYRANRFADAARVYAQVADAEPGYSPALRGLGVSRMRAGDARGAAEAYRAASRLEPTNAAIQVGLARALVQSGDREGAVAAYRLALALDPSHAEAQRELAALAPRPDPALALREEARNHVRARRFGPAAQAYRRITELHGNDAAAFAGLGASLLAGRDAGGAVAAYRRATQLDSSSAGFWAALGAAEEAAGNRQGAVGAYRRALSIDGSLRAPQQALARLDPAPSRPSGLPTAVAVRREPEPPAPPAPTGPTLPETPTRDDIVRSLAPFQPRLESCAPSISGTVLFRMVLLGERGTVREVELVGEHAGSDEAGCMEAHLMGAHFPHFSRPELEIRYPFQLEGPPVPEDAPPVEP